MRGLFAVGFGVALGVSIALILAAVNMWIFEKGVGANSKAWEKGPTPQAARVAELLERSGEANLSVRQAHYRCEQAREAFAQGESERALQLLQETVRNVPQAPRARHRVAGEHGVDVAAHQLHDDVGGTI